MLSQGLNGFELETILQMGLQGFCSVLLKILLKTLLNVYDDNVISTFMLWISGIQVIMCRFIITNTFRHEQSMEDGRLLYDHFLLTALTQLWGGAAGLSAFPSYCIPD